MSPVDRKLLMRIALRLERQAQQRYAAAGRTDESKRTRDNELGDVVDLKDLVHRMDGDARYAADPALTLVPKQPNVDMIAAGERALQQDVVDDERPAACATRLWLAMVAAVRPNDDAP